MAIAFLTDALIDERTIIPGDFQIYNPEGIHGAEGIQHMVLDAQALQHLEVVESAGGTVKGSLLEYVDYCKT
jgi:DNA mismatch repair ATPase MutS